MKPTTTLIAILLLCLTTFLISSTTVHCDDAAWLQPDEYLEAWTATAGSYECDNSTLAPQQFCETIHRWPRALNGLHDKGLNTTEKILETVAMSFIQSIKVKNAKAVEESGATPKYDIPSGYCAGAISNLLCAKFFMKCNHETGQHYLPCKYRCEQVKKSCKGEPLSAYGKAFVKSLNCNDKTKFKSGTCTSDASKFQIYSVATLIVSLVATLFLSL